MIPPALAARLSLIAITDPDAPLGLVEAACAALRGGAPAIQLRAKALPTGQLLQLAARLREETRVAGALLFVNDRVDVAMAADADGAHLGADDLPLQAARDIVPPGFLLGCSVDTPEEARAAERAGADYIGIGPVFPTATKRDTGPVLGLAGVREVRAAVSLPMVAIGGIDARNAADVVAAGANGVAVVRGIMHAADPERATRQLLSGVGC